MSISIITSNFTAYLPALIVDSNQLTACELADHLKRGGFESEVATDWPSAQAAVRGRHYRSLIVVANLAQNSELECLASLRRGSPRSWIIVISGRSYFDAYETIVKHGADSLLAAPFSLPDLTFRLSAFSRRSRPP